MNVFCIMAELAQFPIVKMPFTKKVKDIDGDEWECTVTLGEHNVTVEARSGEAFAMLDAPREDGEYLIRQMPGFDSNLDDVYPYEIGSWQNVVIHTDGPSRSGREPRKNSKHFGARRLRFEARNKP